MKPILALMTAAALTATASAAQPPLYVPFGDYAYAQPTLAAPQPVLEPLPMTPQGVLGGPVISGHPAAIPGQLVTLYPNVRVKDVHKAHPLAVKQVIEVPNPYPRSGCCDPVYVEICVPPTCVPYVTVGPLGQRLTYSFGGHRVVVTSLRGLVTVDYDRR